MRRPGQSELVELELSLPANWRLSRYDSQRRVAIWPLRGMALGGLKLEELSSDDKKMLGLEASQLALKAIHVGKYGKHAAADRAGFKPEDVLVQINGKTERLNEIELIAQNLERKTGETVAVEVLRNRKRVNLTLPIQ